MEQIIGRKPELKMLNNYYKSGKAEFVAVYGRRRVGKTFLIRQFFGNNFDFDATGVMNASKTEELTAFKSYTGTASSLIPTMITTQGLSEGMYSHQIIDSLQLDDLFR